MTPKERKSPPLGQAGGAIKAQSQYTWRSARKQQDFDSLIQAIKAEVSIEELLAHFGHHPARDRSTEAVYHCPLPGHEDKTPSFFVNKAKQVWHCFGCGQGGDVITLVEALEDLPKREAIKWLGRFAGLVETFPEVSRPRSYHGEEEHLPPSLSAQEHVQLAQEIREATRPEKEELDVTNKAAFSCSKSPPTEDEKPPVADPRPAVLADVLEALEATRGLITRYVYLPLPEQADAIALWVAHTWVVEHFQATPYLAVLSPEKRSGKTRLLDVLELLVARPWRVVTPSEAVVFRKVQADKPTLLLDEVDCIFGPKAPATYEGLRALLNAGYRKGTTVPRCVGEGKTLRVENFEVYCPKAFAGIGHLPDTVSDRSIIVQMIRRAPDEHVERFRQREAEERAAPIRSLLEVWSRQAVGLGKARPELPAELDDRAADSWEPLLAIADEAGGEWPERARQAALFLSAGRMEDAASYGVRLLGDIERVFEERGEDRITSAELVEALTAMEESPWEGMITRRLAAKLKAYGITPKQHRFGTVTCKGYLRSDFEDAWRRYLPPSFSETALDPKHPKHLEKTPANGPLLPQKLSETNPLFEGQCFGSKMAANPHEQRNVSDVSDKKAIRSDAGVQMTLSVENSVENSRPPRYQWRLPGGQWRDLVAHPPPILTYFDGGYPVEQRDEALAALLELEWSPRVPPCLAFAAQEFLKEASHED